MENLFSPHQLGTLTLKNRIVMAPMTRSRAIGNIPNDLMAEYYSQRADAGLIVSEGTSPSPNGLGYSRIPGIFTEEQVKAWKKVTKAVHAKDGKIFLQLMHTGRVTHPGNLPAGASVLAPSAVKPLTTKMWVDDQGLQDIPEPRAFTTEEVHETIREHIVGAQNAVAAGFDGIEIHGANGYLTEQFLNPLINQRTDEYGGSVENRSRFLLETVRGAAKAIGKEKIGVRISPFNQFNDAPLYDEIESTYLFVVRKLSELGVAYLHITDPSAKGQPDAFTQQLRNVFQGTLILSGGYTAKAAEEAIENDRTDLVSFARAFIPNPDLVQRFKSNLPLNQPRFDLFYTPGPEGYVDYPVFQDVSVI